MPQSVQGTNSGKVFYNFNRIRKILSLRDWISPLYFCSGDDMELIAEVLVNIPTRKINKLFSYTVPKNIEFLEPGWRVWVPFGGRKVEGFVLAVHPGDGTELKAIEEVWDDAPWFDSNMLRTALWISEYYLCSKGEALRLFVPGGRALNILACYSVAGDAGSETLRKIVKSFPDYEFLLEYLSVAVEPVGMEKLRKKFGAVADKAIQYLLRQGVLVREYYAQHRSKPLFREEYSLAVDIKDAQDQIKEFSGKPAQRYLLELLLRETKLDEKTLAAKKVSRATLHKLIESGFVKSTKYRVLRDSYDETAPVLTDISLTDDQMQAVHAIEQAIEHRGHRSFLLHGVTGSGKTEVYMQAVAAARNEGRQAIVLVPEIALTSQIVTRFKSRFGSDVTVIHSKLSLAERSDAWEKMRKGYAGIVIGARSAIFAPLTDIGIIILDEEHEFTYKQEETPRYHAREVALTRGRLAGAAVVFGSATPSVETYYEALQGKHGLLTLPQRVRGVLPKVSVVDMREELKRGNHSVISAELANTLTEVLRQGEQAVVFLNRRGYSTFVMCRECGHVLTCPHCSVSLVYHHTDKTLRCHYCQRTQNVPHECPECRSRYIRYFGSGTQKVEEELQNLLPGARILRMDQDTTSKKFAHDRILAAFSAGEYDILLGTQMVAKGHDIPNVTAVGIISADTALNLPDFRASERAFSLLMQAAGRAGRGDQPGRVVVQTYNPSHYAVEAGAGQNYASFFEQEIALRASLQYPPFRHAVKLTIYGENEKSVQRQAIQIADELKAALKGETGTEVIGPYVASVAKIEDIYRNHILIKTAELTAVQSALKAAELQAQPGIIIDIDPMNTM